jgi:hypothetical protein
VTLALANGWHALAHVVFAFALWVAFALTTGQLDPVGSAYYGVVVSWRAPVLLTLLVAIQALWTVDAIVLGRRRRSVQAWAGLAAMALALPLALVLSLAQLDLWRHDQHAMWANACAGLAMAALIAGAYAWRRSRFQRSG